ncbi:hypothetical protein GCM10027160_06850 [Streptomyces calidiresistens]|uniref:Type II toxin-antitoxin system HicA family toxin n=2 Tax=Streptomyces TaxID=1883 RepID=A0A7W3TAD6_9ACTN|nr:MULTISPECIES: type II toxin-antitoxin system HicA family toxin [Streptomyces]MBB0229040.1 type II toxin-antitoxin system HicA family toxin [Streptomyces calidiresistens]MBB0243143.1 type II toxin-antitoxin system HicA family toxin [Streptomyces alkaliphilus]MQS06599.1 type II toxin-antitoxin system HicA family toxin [Streptomyces alkaliphilus]
MKRRELIRTLNMLAAEKGVRFALERQGKHEIWSFGPLTIPVPRHNEIAEGTAKAIIQRAQDVES